MINEAVKSQYKHKSISLRIHFKKWKNVVKKLKKRKERKCNEHSSQK